MQKKVSWQERVKHHLFMSSKAFMHDPNRPVLVVGSKLRHVAVDDFIASQLAQYHFNLERRWISESQIKQQGFKVSENAKPEILGGLFKNTKIYNAADVKGIEPIKPAELSANLYLKPEEAAAIRQSGFKVINSLYVGSGMSRGYDPKTDTAFMLAPGYYPDANSYRSTLFQLMSMSICMNIAQLDDKPALREHFLQYANDPYAQQFIVKQASCVADLAAEALFNLLEPATSYGQYVKTHPNQEIDKLTQQDPKVAIGLPANEIYAQAETVKSVLSEIFSQAYPFLKTDEYLKNSLPTYKNKDFSQLKPQSRQQQKSKNLF